MADAITLGPVHDSLTKLDQALAAGQITADAATNLRSWLTEHRYASYRDALIAAINEESWKRLDDLFWTVIPFGTGGRRGMMAPFGSNAINDRTIGESAQGLADYINEQIHQGTVVVMGPPKCAIAYDTRHRSRHFAELCAEVMVANGFHVAFLDGFRSTPELSFAVRQQQCACGIMVTASHNPPSDNAVKVYWSTGGQVLPPHDAGIIARVMSTQDIARKPFKEAFASGEIKFVEAEVDAAFQAAVLRQSLGGPRDLKIIYSPLHGVGASAVLPVLKGDGFKDVEPFGPQSTPDGDFPNVPGHVANPENPAVFDSIIVRAQEVKADVILATDPDCDRLGVAAPRSADRTGAWGTFNGNQIGVLLAEYVLSARKKAGTLSPQHYVVKTLVTSEMIRRIADAYGVVTEGNLQVGFKYIGETIDARGPEGFVFGCEESHGYLVGTHARDKDAAVAAMLMAELAAQVKAAGQTLFEKLDSLYWQYGYHYETQVSVTMPGSQGMRDMQALMANFRTNPPTKVGDFAVVRVRDYLNLKTFKPGSDPVPLDGPKGDMVILELSAEGNYVAVRPSGTEPKVKFYFFAYEPAEQLANLDDAKEEIAARVGRMRDSLVAYAGVKK